MFNKSYNVAAAERANKALANSSIKYTVKMLDETVETFFMSTETKGMNLLDAVCDCLELLERDYFGIQYRIEESSHHIYKWVKMDKLMRKQIKEDLVSKTFHLRVRFIPNDINQMQETYTRYQLFLQIKQDIYSKRINCSKEIAVQLAGLSLQSELNDFNGATFRPGYVGEYRFVPDQTASFEQEVANFHKTLNGLRAEEAEFKFLTISKQLLQYGCDLYNCELMGKPIQFGFNALGISMFPSGNNSFIIPWNAVAKVLKENKSFIITTISTQNIVSLVDGGANHSIQMGNKANLTNIQDKSQTKFKLVFPNDDEANEAYKSSTECHAFFRVRDPKQIQGSSSIKRSHSFFRLTSAPSLFSGRRTLPELLDIRKRSRTLERSFIRTSSKRYTKKNTGQSVLSADTVRSSTKNKKASIGSIISNNKDKTKVDNRKEPENVIPDQSENSEEDADEEEEFSPPDTGSFRPKSLMTQSVRMNKVNTNKEFSKQSVTHSSMPRRSVNINSKRQSSIDDSSADDFVIKTASMPDAKLISGAKSSTHVSEVKTPGSLKNPPQTKQKLTGSVSSMKSPLSTSNSAMMQSTDKLIDLDSCVEIKMKAQDNRYGFVIRGGADTGLPVIVTKVSAGSAADVCEPNLFEGDQIIKINDKFADELTNDEIKEIIRSTGQKKESLLVLTVKSRLYIPDDTATTEDIGTDDDTPLSSPKDVTNDLRTEMKSLEESLKNGSAVALFEKLYKQKQGLSMSEAKKSDNINKNRYKDILPYDQTRVIIRNGDYINANTIKYDVPKSTTSFKYIAAQGPLTHTANDFLTTVWENKTQLVVMLTDLQEKGRSKCYKYWPNNGETSKVSHGIQITCESESILNLFAIREMKMKKANETRKFTHLQYLNWPDHDVPQKMEDFLSFMTTMRKFRSVKSEHILVHCSAGIGRTGVVITMDIAIGLIELKQPFTVISIVKEIRNQRAMLIQSQKQYEFVCRAIINYYSNVPK